MTDTRMVRLEQIAAGDSANSRAWLVVAAARFARRGEQAFTVKVKQIGDATGGDVYEPANSVEASIVAGLVSAKWPHLVQVEVVNG